MTIIRNVLAIIGFLALSGAVIAILAVEPYVSKVRTLDREAVGVYSTLARTVLDTGDASQALVYRQPVGFGRTIDEVQSALIQAARDLGLHQIGIMDIHEEVIRQTRASFPFLRTFLFCDPELAADLIRHNAGLASFLPCRVILHRDERGMLWLMSPNLDLLMHGGRPLPVLLQERTAGLQYKLREIVDRGAGVSPDPGGV
jgi:uncharacterized protein (DUF302 family)